MPVKLIMSWDIAPEHEQEYFEFVVREFIPNIQKLGFTLSDAWATVYGEQPQILVGAVLPDREAARRMLRSDEFLTLKNKLLDFVTNYTQKVVTASSGFQF
jgi:hypothetical protein